MFAMMLAATLLAHDPAPDLASRGAFFYYADLLQQGGYGRFATEAAGFLIRERDGKLTMAPWARREHKRATYRGAIPAGAIAVIHTHPRFSPDPSVYDRDEARRIAMPVIVVTPDMVAVAHPDGSVSRIVEGAGWAERLTR